MNDFDLIEATLRYVIGACFQWEQHAQQFNGRPDDFYRFCLRTHDVAYKYLKGRKTLDGTCSDFECTVALNVHTTFKSLVN